MNIRKLINGIIVVIIVTFISYLIQGIDFISDLKLSSLIIAILVGALIKNTIGVRESMKDGIKFCSKKVLRLAVIMLGFRLSLGDIGRIGFKSLILIVIISTLTLIFSEYVGRKFNISKKLSILIAAGTSICGAAAIAAVNSIIKADEEDVAFSIGVITIFGTIFMFVYPIIFRLMNLDTLSYSVWAGSSIHEVAQVVAAGNGASLQAETTATLVKLTRVLYIIPVTVVLSLLENRKNKDKKFSLKDISVPWFVIMFLVVVILNSVISIPKEISKTLINIDGYLMTAAMAGLGLDLSFSSMRKVGVKPVYVGLIASIFISFLSAGLVKLII